MKRTKLDSTRKMAAKEKRSNTLSVPDCESKSEERIVAETGLSPVVANAQTARIFAKDTFGELDLTEAVEVLKEKVAKIKACDLSEIEATLIAQATSLDAIFNQLARHARATMGGSIQTMEIFLRLAFKAQSQCRATLEALAEIKQPRPVAFVKQANIAHGHQQVNNGVQLEVSRAENFKKSPNELLEVQHGQQLDTRTPTEAIRNDQAMAAMEKINRPD